MKLRLPAILVVATTGLVGLVPNAAADQVADPTATLSSVATPVEFSDPTSSLLVFTYSCSPDFAVSQTLSATLTETVQGALQAEASVAFDVACTGRTESAESVIQVMQGPVVTGTAVVNASLSEAHLSQVVDLIVADSLPNPEPAPTPTATPTSPAPAPSPAPKAPVTLTANASPEPAVMGRTITVNGSIRRSGKAYTKRAARLQFRTATGSYRTLKSVTSSGVGGSLKASVKADRSGCFRYSFPGNSNTKAGASPGDCVKVTTPALYTCSGTAQRRPSTIQLACGDANGYFDQVRWSQWTGTYATGTARQWYNTCNPSCAAGHYVKKRVAVRLYSAKTLDFQRYFSRIRVRTDKSYLDTTPRPHRGCVSNAEYSSVHRHQSRARVERIFDTTGRGTAKHRSYASCTQYTDFKVFAEVWYKNGKVADKHWSDD